MKSKGALTDAQVEKFKGGAVYSSGKSKGKQKPQDFLWCSKEGGFGVRMGMKTGVKTFILQYRLKGASTDKIISIGRFGEPLEVQKEVDGEEVDETEIVPLDVERALKRARELKAKMKKGVDPIAKEKEQQEAAQEEPEVDTARTVTLREVLEHFLTHHRTKHGELRPKTAADYRYYTERHLATWLDNPACEITRAACLERFTEISEQAKISANLTFEYLRALCNHAREWKANEATGEYTLFSSGNPVSRMFKMRPKNPEKPRKRRIPLNKIGAVWLDLQERRTAARTIDQRTAVDWVCTMLLTGMRLSESASLRWPDINLDARTLTLRSNVVKNHNEVTLPMSTLLHEILSERRTPAPEREVVTRRRRVERSSEYVFATNGKKTPHITGAPGVFAAIKKVSGVGVSAHDLRRTFEDLCVAVKVDADQRRLLLNHISGDVHAVSYSNNPDAQEGSALQAAVEAVAAYVTTAAKVAAAGNVVSLPLAAQRAAG